MDIRKLLDIVNEASKPLAKGMKVMSPSEFLQSQGIEPKSSEEGVAEGVEHNVDDLSDVADWMQTTPDKLKIVVKEEPIEKFIKQIREMYGTYGENPKDEVRTNIILKLLKRGAKPLPMYVEDGDSSLFVMEGRHRMVAFYLAGMKTIPVAYVSVKKQGVAEGEVISMRDDRKVLSRLVSDWWHGDEKQHTKAVMMFSKMGYEPYEDGDEIVLSQGDEEIRFSMDEIQENLDEAEKLKGVSQRPFPKDELIKYLDRIVGEPVLDKEGKPKLDKKGNPQFKSLKTKTDKYKFPYIHRSNVPIVNQDGQKYDLDKLASLFTERPSKILKQNEKMQHSDGTASQFYNVGLPALIGLAVDEDNNEFVVINTCPGAGNCKLVCYAMKGGYIQYPASNLSQTRLLNFLYNDPDGFMGMLRNEISEFEAKNSKKNIKTIIRWHDAGDFFSPEYLDKAYNLAKKFPDVDFYAYTKLASVAQGEKPDNFKINFSMGAQPSQEKKIDFAKTKNSRIVPEVIFADLLKKDKAGKWQYKNSQSQQAAKDRIAAKYSLDPKSIITYDEMMKIPVGKEKGKWNVIVKPGDGDDAANRNDVLSSLLLIH